MQVAELKKELESQHKEKEALEARAKNAETKIDVLILKIENVSLFIYFILFVSFGKKKLFCS